MDLATLSRSVGMARRPQKRALLAAVSLVAVGALGLTGCERREVVQAPLGTDAGLAPALRRPYLRPLS